MWMKKVRELCKNIGMFLFTIFQNSSFLALLNATLFKALPPSRWIICIITCQMDHMYNNVLVLDFYSYSLVGSFCFSNKFLLSIVLVIRLTDEMNVYAGDLVGFFLIDRETNFKNKMHETPQHAGNVVGLHLPTRYFFNLNRVLSRARANI